MVNVANVGKYTIHGSYGMMNPPCKVFCFLAGQKITEVRSAKPVPGKSILFDGLPLNKMIMGKR